MSRCFLLPIVLAWACSDYGINKRVDDPDGPDDSDDTQVDTADTQHEEECNGLDDDADGEVDEDFPDTDGDGIADCLDQDCDAELPDPRSEIDDSCTGDVIVGDPPARPWEAMTEWTWTVGAVYATPMVGDLDLDGVPEVVVPYACPSYFPGCLAVLEGDDGSEDFTLTGIDATGGVALGDIDLDGYGDIVTYNYSTGREVAAYDNTGSPMWTHTSTAREENYPVIVDLEGDGSVEVIANELILDGATGALENTLDGATTTWGANAVADLDGDGFMEIMLENRVYSYDGTFLWACGTGNTGTFPQPVNIDSDPYGEVLIAGYGHMELCDDDGTTIFERSYGLYGTPVAVADFDDDGLQEFAFAQQSFVYLIDGDGTDLWTTPVSDYSGLSGCTSWDIDMDGRPEVVYADEQDLLVIDGATGTVQIRGSDHGSVTLAETPAVADVDGDGSGEIIYGSNSGTYNGVTVLGSTDGDWPYSKPVYNQYTYYGQNINDDLSVPLLPVAPWMHEANVFRGQPSALYIAPEVNLQIEITDVCVASCLPDGHVEVAVQIWNSGGEDVDYGVTVNLYGTVLDEVQLIETQTSTAILPTGGSLEFYFETQVNEVGSELYATVDDPSAIFECNEDDNQHAWTDLPCD